jgi:phage terminase large subunit-like protein
MVVLRVPSKSSLDSALDRFKRWKPSAQAKALEEIRAAELIDWHPFYCPNLACNGQPHCWPKDDRRCPNPYGHVWKLTDDGRFVCKDHCGVEGGLLDDWAFPHARTDQRPPLWKKNWLTLFMRGGRGSGKTRTGAEITNRVTNLVPTITLIGATGPDLRNIMVEGESGLLATSAPGNRPKWEPSKKLLTWPNGCKGQGYSAEEPDRLRGQNSGYVWADEPAHWTFDQKSWDNMLFGLRKGEHPKIAATSTPKPTKFVKEQLADEHTVDRVVSTYANLGNLSPVFRETIIKRFEGTRTGQQELHGALLEDVEGSLWKWEMIHYTDVIPEDGLTRVVVSVDPAGTANKKSDETGIIVIGISKDKCLYVLADYTDKYSPRGWGTKVAEACEEWEADAIVAEKNYGGEMVGYVLENSLPDSVILPRIKLVTSRRGKSIRAEPVVALYEKVNRVWHVGDRGALNDLDEELTTWVPGEGDSPNRLDALVHGATDLGRIAMPSEIAIPSEVLKDFNSPTGASSNGRGLYAV